LPRIASHEWGEAGAIDEDFAEQFTAHVNDDLNTPRAVAVMWELAKSDLPSFQELLPLIAMTLAIAFFEALFWRGWVLLRLEDAFGLIPAILLGSALYAAYHVGYGMPVGEMLFLFWIGVLYAVSFRFTRSLFILWPLYQPMGQLVTLVNDRLRLPLLASLGFIEALALMLALVWLADKYYRKHAARQAHPAPAG